jgi:TonB family protein
MNAMRAESKRREPQESWKKCGSAQAATGSRLLSRSILAVCFLLLRCDVFAQTPIRLAVLDFDGDERGVIANGVRSVSQKAASPPIELPVELPVELLDENLTRVASRGAGYAGTVNLSRTEARALGQSLGCEFYILGKVLITRRAGVADQFYFEALAGLFLVETRTGALTQFIFDRAQGKDEQEAANKLDQMVRREWPRCMSAIVSARKRRETEIENVGGDSAVLIEAVTDDPDDPGTERPVFYQRLKPAYTEQADLAGITATVELEAVFEADGEVGDITVSRWAGFGLDESAIATVRQLRFKPARRDGKVVTIRALVRYNFRRPPSQTAAPKVASPEDIERIRRSLLDILLPKQAPGKRPNF